MMTTWLRCALLVFGTAVVAGCGDDGAGVALPDGGDGGDLGDGMASDVGPCGADLLAPAPGALEVAAVPVPRGRSRCRASIDVDEPTSIGVAPETPAIALRLDGDPIDPFPARTRLPPGRHDLDLERTGDGPDGAVRVDVRPDPAFDGGTDCGGAVVLHQARAENLAVALMVPGDGRCETTLLAATPLDDLRIVTMARIHVDVALDGAPSGDADGFSVDEGAHVLTLDIDDTFDVERVAVSLVVGGASP